ncbi:uncharacterized protein K444DRAFT_296714 [Hyaloscypha bicolor E]|uniref:Uncharacterized protein n=1 Tax=Hyaloscypha bicolor E TaxID=1095630 RepID=A0A2J6SEU2_9HELO|nr:uncharacterized protein K444DRAFT_296714 [Hyaloscypha bicolor E]PMD49276.1 hypothetical protein K444DRAFT_296714 [Hyaloscypha bicolor E]
MYDIIFGTTSKKLQKTILDIRKHARHYLYRGQRILAMNNEVSNTGGARSLDKELDLFAEPIKSLLHLYMSTPVPDTIAKYESSSSSATIEEVLSKADAPPQVLLFHIQGILMYLHQDDEFYEDFSYFGERIRYLKLLLQEQKHRTMKELLHNSRQASMVDVPARSDHVSSV